MGLCNYQPPAYMYLQMLLPLLKYVRGEVLSAHHWHELFRMLGMPRGITLEKLTFGDIVSVTDAIVSNTEGLKELFSRAQGEVSIREALRELELWGAGASFSLTGYSDSAEKQLAIIKDWKELVNQVWERDCLFTLHAILCVYHNLIPGLPLGNEVTCVIA